MADPVVTVPTRVAPGRRWTVMAVSAPLAAIALSLLKKWTGFDPQPVIDALWQMSGQDPTLTPSAVAVLSSLIALGIGYFVKPSVADIVSRVTNQIVKLANADQDNPTQAVVVDAQTSQMAAVKDIDTKAIPSPANPPPGLKPSS